MHKKNEEGKRKRGREIKKDRNQPNKETERQEWRSGGRKKGRKWRRQEGKEMEETGREEGKLNLLSWLLPSIKSEMLRSPT